MKGYDFLDGRIVVFRTSDGVAHVLSAYCPHLGADLSVGDVVDDTVRCAFHHWLYDRQGRCVATKVGDPPPRGARLFRFPTVEKFQIIWAFNGEEPMWSLPDFPHPDAELTVKAIVFPQTLPVDPCSAATRPTCSTSRPSTASRSSTAIRTTRSNGPITQWIAMYAAMQKGLFDCIRAQLGRS